ncbi:MAG: formyltetrahydrofolate deformylase [Acidobacteriota bacterium]|nr:formyltetrahydrofolate deformylase [Acidobacteriota bacterium]
MPQTATLLLHCPDRKGIVAALADFVFQHGANILSCDQYQDTEYGLFFMRMQWTLDDFDLTREQFPGAFSALTEKFQLQWKIAYSHVRERMAIFVSHYQHCLVDLLYRHQIGELACEIPLIISNHPDAEPTARHYGIPFLHIPINSANKVAAERQQITALQQASVNLVVLARYMQVLSPDFVAHFPQHIINVHHSLLPAFIGANPYLAAYKRGVRLIGATSHYVTDVLDDGPIIEQSTARISHRDQLEDLKQKGRDQERIVLSRAVRWHLEHRILCSSGRTILFE